MWSRIVQQSAEKVLHHGYNEIIKKVREDLSDKSNEAATTPLRNIYPSLQPVKKLKFTWGKIIVLLILLGAFGSGNPYLIVGTIIVLCCIWLYRKSKV